MRVVHEKPRRARGRPAKAPQAILAAAERRYVRFGPRKTTMGEIAREAGCSRATLYAHFPSKEALYRGLLEAETARFLADVESAADSDAAAPDKLALVLAATLRAYEGSPVLRDALTGDDEMTLERVARPLVRAHDKQVIGILERLVQQGIDAGVYRPVDARAVALLMFDLGRVIVVREVGGRGPLPLRRLLEAMYDLLGQGLAKRHRTPRRR